MASVKTKFAVHCEAPPRNDGAFVKVITPGWIVALPAGAQAVAVAGTASDARASAHNSAGSWGRRLMRFLSSGGGK